MPLSRASRDLVPAGIPGASARSTWTPVGVLAALAVVAHEGTRPEALSHGQATFWYVYVGLLILGLFLVGSRTIASDLRAALVHPPLLVSIWFFTIGIVPGLVGLVDESRVGSLRDLGVWDPSWVPRGLYLFLVALSVLVAVYGLLVRRLHPLRWAPGLMRRRPAWWLLGITYAVTLGVRAFRVATTGVAYGAQVEGLGALAGLNQLFAAVEESRFLVVAYLAAAQSEDRIVRRSLYGVLLVEVMLGLTSGFTKPVLLVLVVAILARVLEGSGSLWISKRRLGAMMLGVLAVIVLATAMSETSRSLIATGSYDTTEFDEVLSLSTSSFSDSWGSGLRAGWDEFVDKAAGRQAQVAHMPGIILRRVPSEIEFAGYDRLLALPTYLVPRVVWPDKPTLSRGVDFSVQVLNMPSDTRSSSAVTVVGEAYMIGGYGGVLVAMLVLAWLFAFLAANTSLLGNQALYAALVPSFIDWEAQFTTMVLGIVQQGLALAAIQWLLVAASARHSRR